MTHGHLNTGGMALFQVVLKFVYLAIYAGVLSFVRK